MSLSNEPKQPSNNVEIERLIIGVKQMVINIKLLIEI